MSEKKSSRTQTPLLQTFQLRASEVTCITGLHECISSSNFFSIFNYVMVDLKIASEKRHPEGKIVADVDRNVNIRNPRGSNKTIDLWRTRRPEKLRGWQDCYYSSGNRSAS